MEEGVKNPIQKLTQRETVTAGEKSDEKFLEELGLDPS